MQILPLDFNYWLNLFMFIPSLFFCMGIFKESLREETPLKVLWILSSVLGVLAIFSFLLAQTHWILTESHSELLTFIVGLWLVFDYTNAAFYLSISSVSYLTLKAYNDRTKLHCKIASVCDAKNKKEV